MTFIITLTAHVSTSVTGMWDALISICITTCVYLCVFHTFWPPVLGDEGLSVTQRTDSTDHMPHAENSVSGLNTDRITSISSAPREQRTWMRWCIIYKEVQAVPALCAALIPDGSIWFRGCEWDGTVCWPPSTESFQTPAACPAPSLPRLYSSSDTLKPLTGTVGRVEHNHRRSQNVTRVFKTIFKNLTNNILHFDMMLLAALTLVSVSVSQHRTWTLWPVRPACAHAEGGITPL